MAEIRHLPSGRAEGAMAFLAERLGNGAARGVLVGVVGDDGNVDLRVFGDVRRYELAWSGAVLTDHAVNGEFEPTA